MNTEGEFLFTNWGFLWLRLIFWVDDCNTECVAVRLNISGIDQLQWNGVETLLAQGVSYMLMRNTSGLSDQSMLLTPSIPFKACIVPLIKAHYSTYLTVFTCKITTDFTCSAAEL